MEELQAVVPLCEGDARIVYSRSMIEVNKYLNNCLCLLRDIVCDEENQIEIAKQESATFEDE